MSNNEKFILWLLALMTVSAMGKSGFSHFVFCTELLLLGLTVAGATMEDDDE